MPNTTAIKATEATLKAFLGLEASVAVAVSASIQRARRHGQGELVLEEALGDLAGERVDSNDHYAWIVCGGGLTLYLDKSSGEFYIGAM